MHVFPVYNLTRSPLTAALYYLNALNRLVSKDTVICVTMVGNWSD